MTTEFINKGTYGCIFHPSINACNGSIENEHDGDNYITKIQHANADSLEIDISNKIKAIRNYEHFFAPVISSCEVTPNRVNYHLIKTCNYMQNDFSQITAAKKYISSKIRYVGKNTIEKYLSHLPNPESKLVNMHLYLLDAIKVLRLNHIMHLDIKPDNILFDEIQSVPIMIDFGLSNTTNLIEKSIHPADDKDALKDIFISDDTYDFWCIDIFIISKIIYEKQFYMDETVNPIQVDLLLHAFKTHTLVKCFTPAELKTFDNNYRSHFKNTYIDNNKTWIDVFNDLIKNYHTWDNYSLSITCLYLHMKNHHKMKHIYPEYINVLKSTILALPNNRTSEEATKNAIIDIFTSRT